MIPRELRSLINKGEGSTLELKKSTAQLTAIFETVCAFLNGNGGVVLVGVTNDGKIIGQDISDNTKQEIANHILKIEPSAQSLIEVGYLPADNNKQVISIAVNKGKHSPYIYDGRSFRRNESTTSKMTQHGYEQLLVARSSLDYSWEKQPAVDYKINMLDHDEVWRTVKRGVKNGRIPSDALDESIEEIIANRFDLMVNNKQLKNAAVVLFAKKINSSYPQCLIKMGRFKGNNDLGDIIDNQQFYGNAFQILEVAANFVAKHLEIASFFEENKFERRDEPTIPILALREAFINAICHRDYSNLSTAIYLSIFDDHLDIWNSGTLPQQLKVDDLKKIHKSYPRNPTISKIFFNRGLVENWGKGTNRMLELCKAQGLPEPQFREYSGGFEVSFKFYTSIDRTHQLPDTSKDKLTLRQTNILQMLSSKISMTFGEITKQLKDNVAPRTIRNDLTYLKRLKLITQKGFGRGAKWIFLRKKRQ